MDIFLAIAASTHLGLNLDYNEFHPHVRIQEERFIAGAYYNSESNTSLYAGYRFGNDLFAEIGAVSGYSSSDILPFVRVGYDVHENVTLFASPAYEIEPDGSENAGAVLGVELKIKLSE